MMKSMIQTLLGGSNLGQGQSGGGQSRVQVIFGGPGQQLPFPFPMFGGMAGNPGDYFHGNLDALISRLMEAGGCVKNLFGTLPIFC